MDNFFDKKEDVNYFFIIKCGEKYIKFYIKLKNLEKIYLNIF